MREEPLVVALRKIGALVRAARLLAAAPRSTMASATSSMKASSSAAIRSVLNVRLWSSIATSRALLQAAHLVHALASDAPLR